MEAEDYKCLRWGFNNITSDRLREAFVNAEDFNKFLDFVSKRRKENQSFFSKEPENGVADRLAVDKVLLIKEASAAKKKQRSRRRAKTTKQKVLERVPEIQALRVGGTFNGVTIEPCTWTEILLYLQQKGIRSTVSYVRTIYNDELQRHKALKRTRS